MNNTCIVVCSTILHFLHIIQYQCTGKRNTQSYKHTHARRHTRTQAHTHACTHAGTHACTHAGTHAGTHACTHAHIVETLCRASPSAPERWSYTWGGLSSGVHINTSIRQRERERERERE